LIEERGERKKGRKWWKRREFPKEEFSGFR